MGRATRNVAISALGDDDSFDYKIVEVRVSPTFGCINLGAGVG